MTMTPEHQAATRTHGEQGTPNSTQEAPVTYGLSSMSILSMSSHSSVDRAPPGVWEVTGSKPGTQNFPLSHVCVMLVSSLFTKMLLGKNFALNIMIEFINWYSLYQYLLQANFLQA